MQTESVSPPEELVRSLLREAAIPGTPESLSLLSASTSDVWVVVVNKQRYIIRHRTDANAQMARKEIYLSDLLRQAGVPAPKVLAAVTDAQGIGTLITFLDGIRLDSAVQSLTDQELHSVWHSTGETLRLAHEIALPEAGEIVGDQVGPFASGWAQWVLEDLAADIDWLQKALDSPKIDSARIEKVIPAAIDALQSALVRLVHNDALPQNILVAPGQDGWRCTGWLDWEFARAADPLWDIGTLDFRPAHLVPSAFYQGYGVQPPEPQVSIYELLMAIWRTRVELEHGSHWDWPPQQARVNYLNNLPYHVNRLADLLGLSN